MKKTYYKNQRNNETLGNVKTHPKFLFTQDEDERLRDLVDKYGTSNWSLIAREMKTKRNCRQCRERWYKYLSPDINHQPWTEEEDNLLDEKYAEYGPKWKTISLFFDNRTDINIKSRWLMHMRKKEKAEKSSKVNTKSNAPVNPTVPYAIYQYMVCMNLPPTMPINLPTSQTIPNRLTYNQAPLIMPCQSITTEPNAQIPNTALPKPPEYNEKAVKPIEYHKTQNSLNCFDCIDDIDWNDFLLDQDNLDWA